METIFHLSIMRKILDALPFDGNKTYIGFIILAAVYFAQSKGYIDATLAADLNEYATLWTGVAVTHKIDKGLRM